MLLVERKSMKIRGEKRFRVAGDAYVSRYVHIFVLDECKCIYQEGCSTFFRDVVRLFLLYSFRRGARRYSAANENSTKMKREEGEEGVQLAKTWETKLRGGIVNRVIIIIIIIIHLFEFLSRGYPRIDLMMYYYYYYYYYYKMRKSTRCFERFVRIWKRI